jgi:hypothetical protein
MQKKKLKKQADLPAHLASSLFASSLDASQKEESHHSPTNFHNMFFSFSN